MILVELLNFTFEQEPGRTWDSNVKFVPLGSRRLPRLGLHFPTNRDCRGVLERHISRPHDRAGRNRLQEARTIRQANG